MITFMKGVKRAKMTSRPLSPSWDLAVVLGALCKPPIVRALRLYRQKTLIDFRSLVAQSSLSRYIVEAIRLAYTAGVPVPEGLRAHSTRAVSAFSLEELLPRKFVWQLIGHPHRPLLYFGIGLAVNTLGVYISNSDWFTSKSNRTYDYECNHCPISLWVSSCISLGDPGVFILYLPGLS